MKKHVMCTWLVGRGGDLVSAVYKNCNDKKIISICKTKTSIEPYTSLRTQFLMNPLTPVCDQDNFFLQHEYTVKQTSNENKEKYLLGD